MWNKDYGNEVVVVGIHSIVSWLKEARVRSDL